MIERQVFAAMGALHFSGIYEKSYCNKSGKLINIILCHANNFIVHLEKEKKVIWIISLQCLIHTNKEGKNSN